MVTNIQPINQVNESSKTLCQITVTIHELSAKQLTDKILELGEEGYTFQTREPLNEPLDQDEFEAVLYAPYKLSLAATRIYLAMKNRDFGDHNSNMERLGLDRDEYTKGLEVVVASGTVLFRLMSDKYKAYEAAWNALTYEGTDMLQQIMNQEKAHLNTLTDEQRKSMTDEQITAWLLAQPVMKELAEKYKRTLNEWGMMNERRLEEALGMPFDLKGMGFFPNVRIVDGGSGSCKQSNDYKCNAGTGEKGYVVDTENDVDNDNQLRVNKNNSYLTSNTDLYTSDSEVESQCLPQRNEVELGSNNKDSNELSNTKIDRYIVSLAGSSFGLSPNAKAINDQKSGGVLAEKWRKSGGVLAESWQSNSAEPSVFGLSQRTMERRKSALKKLQFRVFSMEKKIKRIDAMDSSGHHTSTNSPFYKRRSMQVSKVIEVFSIIHPKLEPLSPDMAKEYLSLNENECWSVVTGMLDMFTYLDTHPREDGRKHTYRTYYRETFRNRHRERMAGS